MMNFTGITLAVVAIVGLTKLLTWWLGKPRRLTKLREIERAILEEMRGALSHGDTVLISRLERELKLVREDIARLDPKRDADSNKKGDNV